MKTPLGLVAWLTVMLVGCAAQPANETYSGPVAKPQVAYRIDDHRFFEVVPYDKFACARARLYYTDTAKGIHTNIAPWDQVQDEGVFMIDAASDQYLVAPRINSSSGCQTGGGDLCAGSLYFSQDSGKTWVRDMPLGGANYLTKNTVYPLHRNRPGDTSSGDKASLDIPIPPGPHTEFMPGGWVKRTPILKWAEFRNEKIPLPLKMPIDTQLHCDRSLDAKE